MFHTILVPLDGSEFGEQALPVAMAVARRTGARVLLARVHEPTSPEEKVLGVPPNLERWGREREALEHLAAELTAAGIPADAALLSGPVAHTLVEHAARVGADLVVMSTHGRGPLSRTVLGSVAAPLSHQLNVPTILIRPVERHGHHGRPAPVRHLLVALDGSADGEAALPAAIELGEAMGARFTLLRVVEPVSYCDFSPTGVVTTYPDEETTRQQQGVAAAYLERVAAPLLARGLDVQTRVITHSDPATGIQEEAHALGCDLIAIGAHARSGLNRLILGSVTDAVVRGGATPVMAHATRTR